MKKLEAFKDDIKIVDDISAGDTFFTRFIGLINREELSENQGLLLIPCRQIHTFYMKFPIDALFLDEDGEVIYIERNMPSNKISKYIKEAHYVLELKGTVSAKHDLKAGDVISFKEKTV